MLLLACMVALQFSIVVGRYVFGINYIWAQELVGMMHATIFMLAAAWTLAENRHVRLDIVYGKMDGPGRRKTDLFGTLLLLFPLMLILFLYSFGYVVEAWSVQEGSAEIAGLPGRFILKTLIPVFAILMLLAGIFRIFRLRG